MRFVSILIPVYNGARFLPECIESIKNQTHKNWEVLIGVNGHEPNSITQKYCELFSDENIKVFYYSTKGKSNTLNEMVKDSTHDIVCLLDVDDIWLPTKLSEQLKHKQTFDVVGSQCYYMYDYNKSTFTPNIPLGPIKDFVTCNPIINSSCMINKTDAYWDGSIYNGLEDYDLWLRLHKQKRSFYNVAEPLLYHRIHKDSHFNASGRNNDTTILFK